MKVLREIHDNEVVTYAFYCLGCKHYHAFDPRWTFDGNMENPTFSPSLLISYPYGPEQQIKRCHSYVRSGKIEYLSDCTHELAGQTVDMEEEED